MHYFNLLSRLNVHDWKLFLFVLHLIRFKCCIHCAEATWEWKESARTIKINTQQSFANLTLFLINWHQSCPFNWKASCRYLAAIWKYAPFLTSFFNEVWAGIFNCIEISATWRTQKNGVLVSLSPKKSFWRLYWMQSFKINLFESCIDFWVQCTLLARQGTFFCSCFHTPLTLSLI